MGVQFMAENCTGANFPKEQLKSSFVALENTFLGTI